MADARASTLTRKEEPHVTLAEVEKATDLVQIIEVTESHLSKPERTDIARTVLDMALEQPELLEGTYSGMISDVINEMIGSLDQEISLQLDEIMHAEAFQKVEATWRGLAQLVCESETSDLIKIKVFDVSKRELAEDLVGISMTKPDIFQTHFFQKIHVDGYGSLEGKPYGLIVGDYEFTPERTDVELLRGIAQVAAVAHAPFVAAASPAMFGARDFTRLTTSIALDEILGDNGREQWKYWREFRDDPNSRYVGLVLPHVLMRAPFERNAKNRNFSYQENVSDDYRKYCWGNAAWAYASCVTGAFDAYSWCTAIRGYENGLVHLPDHTFDSAGLDVTVGPTDIKVDLGREQELSGYGFLPLIKIEGKAQAVFLGWAVVSESAAIPRDRPHHQR